MVASAQCIPTAVCISWRGNKLLVHSMQHGDSAELAFEKPFRRVAERVTMRFGRYSYSHRFLLGRTSSVSFRRYSSLFLFGTRITVDAVVNAKQMLRVIVECL